MQLSVIEDNYYPEVTGYQVLVRSYFGMKDYYTILGVAKGATQEEIKKAYRRLAHKHHPDRAGGDEARFKEINEAYYVLSDAQRRVQYDRFGTGPNQTSRATQGSPFVEGFDSWFSDMVAEFFGDAAARQDARGRDIAVELTVTLEQALKGVREEIAVSRWVACDRCQGGGGEPGTSMKTCTTCSGAGKLHRVEQTFLGTMTRLVRCPLCRGAGEVPEAICTTCKGSGRIRKHDRIPVTLPPGMDAGDTFMVEGGGDVPVVPRVGRSGSLYVTIHVASHSKFRREGDDLWTEEEVSFLTLLSGGTVTVQGLDAIPVRIKIPEATPSGKVFRVSGQGMPRRKRSRGKENRGDLYVTVHARVPTKPSKRLLEFLHQLEDEL